MKPIHAVLFLFLLASGCSDTEPTAMEFTGLLDARVVRISAQTPGTITAVPVDEGSTVREGDTLASIRTERLGLQQQQAGAVRDELARQREALQAQLAAARVARENTQKRLERFTALLEAHAATQQSVDDLRAQRDAADANIRAMQQQVAALESKSAQAEKSIGILRTQLDDANITSPIDGTVLIRYADPGELAAPGTPLVDLADLRHMWTRIYVSQQQLPFIRIGQKVRIGVDGLENTPLEGTVAWISDKAEFTPKAILTEETRTTLVYAAKILIENPDGIVKIGMPVIVTVLRP